MRNAMTLEKKTPAMMNRSAMGIFPSIDVFSKASASEVLMSAKWRNITSESAKQTDTAMMFVVDKIHGVGEGGMTRFWKKLIFILLLFLSWYESAPGSPS